jgi:hypothetical protein
MKGDGENDGRETSPLGMVEETKRRCRRKEEGGRDVRPRMCLLTSPHLPSSPPSVAQLGEDYSRCSEKLFGG